VADPLPGKLVLYDGVCGFCDQWVQKLLERDRNGELFFAPLQGPTARAILGRHPEAPKDLDAVVYVTTDAGQEKLVWRSEAVFDIYRDVGGRGPIRWLGSLPRFLLDLGYRIFAKLRYRVFGKLDACRVPSDAERARFLP